MPKIKILGISGSLRKESYNTTLLKTIKSFLPDDAEMEIFDIGTLPLFNPDLETSLPETVVKFKSAIKNSDAIIFASPEYNYSITGVLKNAIDWGSRPKDDNSFDAKPGAIVGASNGRISTGRSQYELRKICFGLNMYLLNKPEVMVGPAGNSIDESGNITDAKTNGKLQELVTNLIPWISRLK